MKCKICGATENLQKHGWRLLADGLQHQVYICRTCNTQKVKRERQRNPAAQNRATAKYRSKFKEKHNARLVARKNIPLKPCQVCNGKISVRHHEDHSKPLKVVFLCHLHHKQVHLGVISCPK